MIQFHENGTVYGINCGFFRCYCFRYSGMLRDNALPFLSTTFSYMSPLGFSPLHQMDVVAQGVHVICDIFGSLVIF